MNSVKMKLVREALKTYKRIYPCGSKATLAECFTYQGNKVLFWFDTEDKSTHLIIDSLPAAA